MRELSLVLLDARELVVRIQLELPPGGSEFARTQVGPMALVLVGR